MPRRGFCDCCDYSVIALARLSLPDRLKGTTHEGMKSILQSNSLAELDSNGKQLIDWCIDFLLFNKKDINFPKKNQNQFHKNKYICIWSFIYDFLKIPQNSGYDYWLMSFLEWNELMEHGSGIRCGWATHELDSYQLRPEREQEIIQWAENCPDEL